MKEVIIDIINKTDLQKTIGDIVITKDVYWTLDLVIEALIKLEIKTQNYNERLKYISKATYDPITKLKLRTKYRENGINTLEAIYVAEAIHIIVLSVVKKEKRTLRYKIKTFKLWLIKTIKEIRLWYHKKFILDKRSFFDVNKYDDYYK